MLTQIFSFFIVKNLIVFSILNEENLDTIYIWVRLHFTTYKLVKPSNPKNAPSSSFWILLLFSFNEVRDRSPVKERPSTLANRFLLRSLKNIVQQMVILDLRWSTIMHITHDLMLDNLHIGPKLPIKNTKLPFLSPLFKSSERINWLPTVYQHIYLLISKTSKVLLKIWKL